MSELSEILATLGLEQYHDALISEGFDSWDTVQDITEGDLDALNVKLGHRRKLQRYIASRRGLNVDQPLTSPYPDVASERGADGSVSTEGQVERTPTETKRKYRRHPKADENAPERPPSAYVLFSNHIREEIKGKELSFTDIAKLVGQRWQALTAVEREPYETRAASLKDVFSHQLAEYKKSDHYRQYAQYLADFRAKHGGAPTDGKRPKLEEEVSGGSSGSPIVPTLSATTAKSSESFETPRGTGDAAHARTISATQSSSTTRAGVNPPVSASTQHLSRHGSTEAAAHPGGTYADPIQPLTTRTRGLARTPPPLPHETSGGYFDPLARHARMRSAASQHSTIAPPLDSGKPSHQPAHQTSHQPSRPPSLVHHDTSHSSVPSTTMSYGSASSGLPWTPQTPRDEPMGSKTSSTADTLHSKGPAWDGPRPILPPFPTPASHSFPGLQPLKIPERSFAHPTDPSLRLPPPNLSIGSSSSEARGRPARAPPPRPPPQFSDQTRSVGSREESTSEGSRPGPRREESGIDLLARAIDEQRERRQP